MCYPAQAREMLFLHESSTTTAVFMAKQKQLQLLSLKLIMEISSNEPQQPLGYAACYLEQQAAVTAALTSPELSQNVQIIDTFDTLISEMLKTLRVN